MLLAAASAVMAPAGAAGGGAALTSRAFTRAISADVRFSAESPSCRTIRPRGRIRRRRTVDVIVGCTVLARSACCTVTPLATMRCWRGATIISPFCSSRASSGTMCRVYQTSLTRTPTWPNRTRRWASSTCPTCDQAASINGSCWSCTTRVPNPAAMRNRGSRFRRWTQLDASGNRDPSAAVSTRSANACHRP